MTSFISTEAIQSQIPALQLLMNLGYQYLSPAEVLRERMDKQSNVLLESILFKQLQKINRIYHKGQEYLFSEANVQEAIQKLKSIKFDGLVRTNEQLYDLLTLGTTQEQLVEGDKRSFNFRYIDWEKPENNVYHLVPEFSVERSRSTETARPDIVLFVNGIPFVVIESKSPQVKVEEAVSQCIRNQQEDYIPHLFTYVQMVLAINKNAAAYGTVGTPDKFWGVWKELEDQEEAVHQAINQELTKEQKDLLFGDVFRDDRQYFYELEQQGKRLVTEQDRLLYSLCRPERLLELAYGFTLFDGGIKKIARYQQFFVIRSALRRIQQRDEQGRRRGGIIWHTQGSGKSLTMVMLARALAVHSGVLNPRIVLVTDRDDLDKQLANTFKACGLEPQRASSGKNLLDLISENRASLITTLVHKFDKALNVRKHVEKSADIFILIDEAHRSQYKNMNARMQQMLPNACYLGFTGTPLLKEEKNSFAKFGEILEPHYSIRQAVDDKAVLPLLYEGRHVEMLQNKEAIDLWFERHTQGLNEEQKADLKKKYARAEMLNKADQVVYMRAFDISEHFREHWQGSEFKAQLVAPSKNMAVLYKKHLDEIGFVSSEVIISAPDTRSGYEEVDEEPDDRVLQFWKKMMTRFGSEEEYTKQIINQFKNGEHPEILIVCDKLLTGFDAPRNTVLYLCRTLREHTLLQAIARVNRLYDKKEHGYIVDYANVLGELDSALGMYSAFGGFDPEDMQGTLHNIQTQVDKLPQLHSQLWDVFKTISNKQDTEAFERLLADEELRQEFYDRLRDFAKCLSMALSTQNFLENVSEQKQRQYKGDLKRFSELRKAVKLRYGETIEYSDYEPKIEKLLNTHIQANTVYQLNEPVNIFDDQAFDAVMEERREYRSDDVADTTAAQADTIAHAMKRTITEKMDEDPAFYEKMSKMIQDAIDAFREQRITALQYLEKSKELREKMVHKKHDDVPAKIAEKGEAQAYYGVILPFFSAGELDDDEAQDLAADVALAVSELLAKHQVVQFWDNESAQNEVINAIDDYLYDVVKKERGVSLSIDAMDSLIEKTMTVARHRSGS
jgi:type I restriction enzyme R subunit